ncbi:MAG: hypothetical protein V3574_04880 [Candidatus Moraniibacteriota bacterium]
MQIPDPILEIEKVAQKADEKLVYYQQTAVHRYPILFSFLAVFSTASIIYGFELILSRVDFFKQYPFALILIGTVVLFFTGMLYKALGVKKDLE